MPQNTNFALGMKKKEVFEFSEDRKWQFLAFPVVALESSSVGGMSYSFLQALMDNSILSSHHFLCGCGCRWVEPLVFGFVGPWPG